MSPPTFSHRMEKVKTFAVIAAFLLLAGCDSGASVSWRNDTPQPTVLRFATPTGGVYTVSISGTADTAAIIAANTQLGNALIGDAATQQAQAQQAARRDWLGVVYVALVCVSCGFFGLAALRMILNYIKGSKI